jgi:antitoxin HicB
MKTYVFRVEVEQDEDGRWGADIPVLPGCAAWGYTREEALEALHDTAQAFLEVMMEHNDPLPKEAEEEARLLSESELISVTL